MSVSLRDTGDPERFLSRAECVSIAQRLAGMTIGGGNLRATMESTWRGAARVGRNTLHENTDMRDTRILLRRMRRGGAGEVISHGTDDVALKSAVRRAERFLDLRPQSSDARFEAHLRLLDDEAPPMTVDEAKNYISESARLAGLEALTQHVEADVPVPDLFSTETYNLDAGRRADAINAVLAPVEHAGVFAACYLEVGAAGRAIIDTVGQGQYCPTTTAQFSVTVRTPDGSGSGWAGVSGYTWSKVDAVALNDIAIDKCLRSKNPVRLEPGRYVTILEPQAVWDLCSGLFIFNNRGVADSGAGPYSHGRGGNKRTLLGEKFIDERLTVRQDPMDPDVGFVPYGEMGTVSYPTTWIERGILKNLAYERPYAVRMLGQNTGLPLGQGLRMDAIPGSETSVAEMIATTRRGVYVTRFSQVVLIDFASMTYTGYTRDGTWLIENGKITKPIKNFRFVESATGTLNRVEQVGASSQIWNPLRRMQIMGWPGRHYTGGLQGIVPTLKVRDFNFVALSEAV